MKAKSECPVEKSRFRVWLDTWKTSELAKALDMTTVTISLWRRQKGHPTPRTAARIILLSGNKLTWSDIYGYLLIQRR
jgi:hypothetical protein